MNRSEDSSKNVEENSSEPTPIMHELYEINGIYDFDGLDLREYGWRKIHPCTNEQRKDPEETLVYTGPQGIAIMHLNYETHYHQVDITLKNYSENNPGTMENLKLMFERNLECKLKERRESPLDLMDKIESN